MGVSQDNFLLLQMCTRLSLHNVPGDTADLDGMLSIASLDLGRSLFKAGHVFAISNGSEYRMHDTVQEIACLLGDTASICLELKHQFNTSSTLCFSKWTAACLSSCTTHNLGKTASTVTH